MRWAQGRRTVAGWRTTGHAALLGSSWLLLSVPALAAQEAATVLGRVTVAETGVAVEGAVVRLEGTELVALTDSLGRYRLHPAPPGPAVLRVERIGFAPARVSLRIPTRGTLSRDVQLAQRALEMAGLTVTVDAVSRARDELGTASVIDLEAIRHQTATSLAGVLELVPGVQMEPPGLGSVQQIPLRSAPTSGRSTAVGGIGAQDLASFGTLVVLDGVPVSNNANLQTTGPRGEIGLGTSFGGGIDLRRIPANTLERVEVIRGLPSVRHGDLTQGAIVVDTRAGRVPPEVGGQFDSRTSEGSLIWGRPFGGDIHTGTLTFDAARTRIRPGVSEDDAYRFTGQLAHRAEFGPWRGGAEEPGASAPAGRVVLDTRVDAFQLVEDLPENPNVRLASSRRKRDWGLRVIERLRMRLGEESRLRATASFSAIEQDARSRAEKVRGAQPFTDRLVEGRQEGFFVLGPFDAEVEVDGGPRLFFGRVELDVPLEGPGARHRLRLGIEPRREWNAGEGRQFDIARPPQTAFTGVQGIDRPRAFDDVTPLVTTGLYAEDRLRLPVGATGLFQAQAGLRLDLLHEGESWFTSTRDVFLQPRLNLELAPVPRLRLRGGWGRVAKSPNLLQLSPDPQYYDVVNVNFFADDPAERLAVLTTFIRDPTNPDLGFIRATKSEVGVEVGVGEGAVSLVAFRDRIEDGIAFRGEPGFILRERFALTDSVAGNGIKPEIIEPAIGVDTIPILVDRPANIVEQTSRGLELVASLPELRLLRTRLQVSGSLVETEQVRNGLDFGPRGVRGDFSNFQLQENVERAPFWDPATEFGKRALVAYRAVHHQPDIGLLITAALQHNITDRQRDIAATDTLAFAGFITRDGRLERVPPERRGDPEFADLRRPRSGFVEPVRAAPADWFMSVQVSKTLPLDGRLNFWAFNLLDRRGVVNEPRVLRRPFPPMRFGLELLLPLEGLVGER